MSERTALITRVYNISKDLNIEQTLVDKVIKAYLNYCKVELSKGKRVNFCGIAIIVPDNEIDGYKTTLAYRCKQIANDIGVPYYTVFQIVRGYLDTIESDIYNGRSANIYGFCTVKPLSENGIITRIHSSISQSLQEYLADSNNHARIYTNKIFKRRIREAQINDRKNP